MEQYKSSRLTKLTYDIRGPIFDRAQQLISEGINVITLNIGNPFPFGLEISDQIKSFIKDNLDDAQGYSHHLGLLSAREAIRDHYLHNGFDEIITDDVFIGNGVSELITMSLLTLLEPEDEVLVPSPDYPLWTASVSLADGKAVHYLCDEANAWNPSIEDITRKISPKTRAIVIINPNNPTGAVYSETVLKQIYQIAEKHNLVVFSDEIYDQITYEKNRHLSIANLGHSVLCVTLGGLSKNYFATGIRAGWIIVTGPLSKTTSYKDGLNLLASMRLCANLPGQIAISAALKGNPYIKNHLSVGGRLYEQRNMVVQRINDILGLSCTEPNGAFYIFPKIDLSLFDFEDDESFVLSLLEEKNVLLVPGSGFNTKDKAHFRLVFLAEKKVLNDALDRIETFLEDHRK